MATLQKKMLETFGGLYAKGISWIGYENGTIMLNGNDIVVPIPGTPSADFSIAYREDVDAHLIKYAYTGVWVIIVRGVPPLKPLRG